MDSGVWGSASAPVGAACAKVGDEKSNRFWGGSKKTRPIAKPLPSPSARFAQLGDFERIDAERDVACPEHVDFCVNDAMGRRIALESRYAKVGAQASGTGSPPSGATYKKIRVSPQCAASTPVAVVATVGRNSCGPKASRLSDASG